MVALSNVSNLIFKTLIISNTRNVKSHRLDWNIETWRNKTCKKRMLKTVVFQTKLASSGCHEAKAHGNRVLFYVYFLVYISQMFHLLKITKMHGCCRSR